MLIRIPLGRSIAAAKVKDSIAPFARAATEPAGIGSLAKTPVIKVNEPPSFRKSIPALTNSTWPKALSFNPIK